MKENIQKKRIIPVSSGKGGVGKTTIAINLALEISRFKKVLLVDLDLGTSSIRNSLNIKIKKDLYHFFKKDEPLKNIALSIENGKFIKERKEFKNFQFIASPDGFIDEIASFDDKKWEKFYREINSYDAEIVLLDLKAGFDKFVFNFLPLTNSGLLILSPKNPPSIYSGAELVKHTLISGFRKILELKKTTISDEEYNKKLNKIEEIKELFIEKGSPIENFLDENDTIENLWLKHLKNFRINLILNFFNGLKDSLDRVLLPFYYHLEKRISHSPVIDIFGWVVEDKEIFEKNLKKVPAIFDIKKKGKKDRYLLELQEIEKEFTKISKKKKSIKEKKNPLDNYIKSMKEMFDFSKNKGYKENFLYISHKIVYTVEKMPYYYLGMSKLPPLQDKLFGKYVSLL